MSESVLTAPEPARPASASTVAPRRRQGPLAQYWTLTRTLAFSEFKHRYAGSTLGYFWTVSKPLMLFGVLYVVFSHVLRVGADVPHYPVLLLAGIVLWGFFSEATSASVYVLVQRADMLRKAAFPRSVLPVSVNLTALLIMAFNFVAVFVFMIATGLEPHLSWLFLPVLLGELCVLTMGVSLMLSAMFVRMRDIGQIWQVLLQMLFYATPIIYPIEAVPERWRKVLIANPIGQVVQDFRAALVGDLSKASTSILGPKLLVVPFAITLGTLVLGTWLYRRNAAVMAEHV